MSPVGACRSLFRNFEIPVRLLHRLPTWSVTVPRPLFPALSKRHSGPHRPLGDVARELHSKVQPVTPVTAIGGAILLCAMIASSFALFSSKRWLVRMRK